MVELSIIQVSYNGKEFLRESLRSILRYPPHVTYEIIVVDNNSEDGSAEMVEKEYPMVKLIRTSNEGFGAGNNKGVKIAKGKYMLFFNIDTLMREKTLDGMLQFLEEHPNCGAATCKLEMESGEMDYAAHRGFPTPWNAFSYFTGLSKLFPSSRLFAGYTMGWEDLNRTHEVDSIAGAFMMMPRRAGEEVGWWDTDYFFNGEDIDFCFRLKKKGWKIYYVPHYSILHYSGIIGGTKKHTDKITTASLESKKRAQNARFDAMKIFYMKHYKEKYPTLLTTLVLWAIEQKRKGAIRN